MKKCSKNALKSRKGITLIALVVTIIVLLILAGISIAMLTGENGILQRAAVAKKDTERVKIIETAQIDILGKQIKNHGTLSENELEEILTSNSYNTKGTLSDNNEQSILEKTLTSSDGKYSILVSEIYNGPLTTAGNGEETVVQDDETETESPYIGCYADIDGSGTIDGIIYADLENGKNGNGDWGSYTVPKISGTKEYRVSQTDYTGIFGTKDVISPVEGTNGYDRFYIMSLSPEGGDSNPNIYHWYYKAAGNIDYDANTSTDFGTGKNNTEFMNEYYGTDDYPEASDGSYSDVWDGISSEITNGWFLPSRDEMVAFLNEFNITSSTYPSLTDESGSMIFLTSSTVYGTGYWACCDDNPSSPYINSYYMQDYGYAWLSKTF